MSNIYFYLLVLAMVTNTFFMSNCYSKVNRSFLLFGNGIMEASVVLENGTGNDVSVYFDQEMIEKKTKQYFKENIKKYVSEGEFYVTLFKSDEDRSVCTLKCQGAAIRLKAKINYVLTFDKQLEFVIKRNEV